MTEPDAAAIAAAAKAEAAALEAANKAKTDAAKFTQADLDAVAGKARAEGKTTAEAEALKALGVASIEDAKAALAAKKAADDAALSELELATKARDEAIAEATKVKAEAENVLVETKLESALLAAGISPERVPQALKLVDRTALAVTGSDVAGVAEAAAKLAADLPEWKSAKPGTLGAPQVKPGEGDGAVTNFRDLPNDDPRVLAALAKARNPWA